MESTETIVRKIALLQCKTIIRDSSRTSEAYVLKIAVEAGRYYTYHRAIRAKSDSQRPIVSMRALRVFAFALRPYNLP